MSWLNKSCLVLDKSWRAINVVPVHRAICMVFARGHIVVDSDYGHRYRRVARWCMIRVAVQRWLVRPRIPRLADARLLVVLLRGKA